LTGAGTGSAGGEVDTFDGITIKLASRFFAYPQAFTGSVFVAGN
jgi:hypothetical protein